MAKLGTAVIGDVHGMLREFSELLNYLHNYHVIQVGDLVDKGPQSLECVKLARDAGITTILGNHEEWYVRYYRHESRKALNPAYVNPMKVNDAKRKLYDELRANDLIPWLAKLPYYYDTPEWAVVHGGILPGEVPVDKQELSKVVRLRYVDPSTGKMLSLGPNLEAPEGGVYWTGRYTGQKTIIFGHNAWKDGQVRFTHNTVGVDTGAVYGAALSAYLIEEKRVVRVMSSQAHASHSDETDN